MAIVKMKHLRMVAMQSDREELLRLLQRMGCVEIDEPRADEGLDPAWAELSRPDGERLTAARERKNEGEQALSVLNRYAPKKGGLFRERPVLTEEELFEPTASRRARHTVESINETQRDIAILQAHQAKLQGYKAALAPWLSLDIPLETQSTREVAIHFGTLPASADLKAVEGELLEKSDLIQLTLASSDRDEQYLLLMCHMSVEEDVMAILKDHGWSRANLREWEGTAAENDRRIDQELSEIDEQLKNAQALLTSHGQERENVYLDIDRAAVDLNREDARSRLLETRQTFFLEGWIPAEQWEKTKAALDAYPCACEVEDPTQEEYPTVPVKLHNNWLTRPLNMVTEMYSLPAYGSLDPNPLMAPFFILFYGIMMADMGYGLVMLLIGLVILKKMKPKGGMRNFAGLISLCGVSTFIMGALTGGFFGDFLTQLMKIINPESTFALPALFTPLDDTLMILVGSMCLGVIQIVTGMAISFIKKIRDGKIMDAVWEELTWWVVFAGIAVMALGKGNLVLYAGIAMVVIGPLVTGKGFGKITGIFGSVYNHVTGYFGDVLSYARLMALMLAGSVIAQVFNTLGAIPGNVIVFFIISMAGNTLNFALNLLGCYVHDLRLQCLEYFGKFYEDGGKPFKPMEMNTKYVDVKPYG